MTNRRAKIAAGATVVGLGALGGVALGTNPGMPAARRLASAAARRRRHQRQRRGHGAGGPERGAAADAAADRHPRQRRRSAQPTSRRRTEHDFEQAEDPGGRQPDGRLTRADRGAARSAAHSRQLHPAGAGGPARARLGGRHESRLGRGGGARRARRGTDASGGPRTRRGDRRRPRSLRRGRRRPPRPAGATRSSSRSCRGRFPAGWRSACRRACGGRPSARHPGHRPAQERRADVPARETVAA